MRNSIGDQLKDFQVDFLTKGQDLEENAESSPNPEAAHEWAQTLKDLSHTGVDTVEELEANEPTPVERPSNTFMIGTRFSDMEEEPSDPIWPGWLYRGKITGIIGEEGTGKSTLMTALAAIFSTGRQAPDGNDVQKGTVLYIGPEEDDEGTVLSRLKIEEANLENVVSLRRIFDKGFKLPTHKELLEAAIIHYKACLVVIDPLAAVIEKGKTINTVQGAYDILDPLQYMLHESRCSLAFIHHFTKSKSGKTSDRGAGSKGIYNYLRVYCTLYIDPLNGKVVLHEDKNNLLVNGDKRPNDVYIERFENGKLFFTGAGAVAEFQHATEKQRMSINQLAIMKVLDSDPMNDFLSAEIHQTLRQIYPDMPYNTTRSSLKRLSEPDSNGNIHIGQAARGYYFSLKRIDLIAAQQKDKAVEEEEEKEPGDTNNVSPIIAQQSQQSQQSDVAQQKTTIIAPTVTNPDLTKQATMVL